MRARLFILPVLVCCLVLAVWLIRWHFSGSGIPIGQEVPAAQKTPASPPAATASVSSTDIYAHNLRLRKGPNFRVYVRWLRGRMTRAKPNVIPSFDDSESFYLDVKTGVLRANIGDIGHFLNTGMGSNTPFRNITLSGNGDQLRIQGTFHKVVSLPVEILGTISAVADNKIQLHVTKINVLKVPLKGLLGGLSVDMSDLFKPQNLPGVQVNGNDILFDTKQLLPPPHIRGQLTQVRVDNPDLEEVYGNAQTDVDRVEEWRNFLRLRGGTIDFGKLTMRNVDIVMVDLSNDAWFDLDLNNYQAQLVNGYTRMTPQAGLQIFMPDLDQLPPAKTQNVSLEWMKNRKTEPPAEILQHK